jgi:hypothetical protein
MINVQSSCILNRSIPQMNTECLVNLSFPCSSFVQSYCSYIRFEPLFDVNQIYVLEKEKQQTWKFILETYRNIPIMISSMKSNFFNYSISYQINRLNNGIIQIIGVSLERTNILNKKKIEYSGFDDKSNEVISNEITREERISRIFSDDLFGSSMISLRLGLLQYGYSCKQMPSFVR